MSSADYRVTDISAALRAVGVKRGDVVFSHSNIGFFGRLDGADTAEQVYAIFKRALFDVLGAGGTFVVPTFSYSSCQRRPFDVLTTPGQCGMLAECVRMDPMAVRSTDPNFSVAAVGALAPTLCSSVSSHPFGPDSFWDRFLKHDGLLVNLNFDSGTTFMHYVERQLGVPYRWDKSFAGQCLIDGAWVEHVSWHYVFDHAITEHYPDFSPSMANDNLSGVALVAKLTERMNGSRPKFTYRCLFIPETIGSIAWLAENRQRVAMIRHGLVAACVGDPRASTYKRSRSPAVIDKVAEIVLRDSGAPFRMIDFFPWGSDERQFCSPGFDMPVGSLMRTPYAEFPEYHPSADSLEFVSAQSLGDSLAKYAGIINVLETDGAYVNLAPHGEPQLGRRGLYQQLDAQRTQKEDKLAICWVLNLSDGRHSLTDISLRSGLPFRAVRSAADALIAVKRLAPSRADLS